MVKWGFLTRRIHPPELVALVKPLRVPMDVRLSGCNVRLPVEVRREGGTHEKSWLEFANNMFAFVVVVSSFVSDWNYASLNEFDFFNVAFWTKYRWRFQVVCSSTRKLGTLSMVAQISVCGFWL